MRADAHAEHFESAEQQRYAARLGMWIFLASEVLLFSGLFALYATERARHPSGFAAGIRHADLTVGSINTIVLLASSYLVASAVHALRRERPARAAGLTLGTIASGLVFLGLKAYEYSHHIAEGAVPGGRTHFFVEHRIDGLAQYFNLYWISTFTHALHVLGGMSILAFFASALARKQRVAPQGLENAALYWHLVDAIWIMLWPLYYLVGG